MKINLSVVFSVAAIVISSYSIYLSEHRSEVTFVPVAVQHPAPAPVLTDTCSVLNYTDPLCQIRQQAQEIYNDHHDQERAIKKLCEDPLIRGSRTFDCKKYVQ